MGAAPAELSTISEYERIQQAVLPLLELEGDSFEAAAAQFVGDRVAELEAGAAQGVFNADDNFQGYIGPELELNQANAILDSSLVLDDRHVYDGAMSLMRHYYRSIIGKVGGDVERAYRNAVYHTAQDVQQQYFESVFSGAGARAARERLYLAAPGRLSITLFKKIAECPERVAVANNVVRIFGINPVYESGNLERVGDSPLSEPHTFLLVPGTKGAILFDPTNPTLVLDDTAPEGTNPLREVRPALYPVGDMVIAGRHSVHRQGPSRPVEVERLEEYHLTADGVHTVEATYAFTPAYRGQDLRPY